MEEMESLGYEPNIVSYTSLLQVCAGIPLLKNMRMLSADQCGA